MIAGSARLARMHHHEPARDLIITESCDVLVAGGGPAGVCAAIAAARSGARTRLIEVHGCLGGIWTAGCLGWVIDSAGKGGILREILQRVDQKPVFYVQKILAYFCGVLLIEQGIVLVIFKPLQMFKNVIL